MLNTDWRSASLNNGTCLEVRMSGCGNGACVEVRSDADLGVQVRDSKDITGPTLSFAAADWNDFLAGVRNHEFDL
jgi:predicted secreted Zn-dependent protease